MNVVAIQSQPQQGAQSSCSSCGAPVAADQRYCLSCGRPCSPVRLPFLDVLQAERDLRGAGAILAPTFSYPPAHEQGAVGRLRGYSGVLGLLAVLLTTGLIGLLVGHWLSAPRSAAPSVIKVEGGLPATASAAPSTSTSPASSTPPSSSSAGKASSGSSPTSEAQEVKEVKEAETAKVKPKAPVKTSSSSLHKLSGTQGKAHRREIEKLTAGDKPIETGG